MDKYDQVELRAAAAEERVSLLSRNPSSANLAKKTSYEKIRNETIKQEEGLAIIDQRVCDL